MLFIIKKSLLHLMEFNLNFTYRAQRLRTTSIIKIIQNNWTRILKLKFHNNNSNKTCCT
jgi:hypothetical protein